MSRFVKTVCLLMLSATLSSCATKADPDPAPTASEDQILGIMFGGSRDANQLDAQIEAASAFELGSERNPVRADMPAGQRQYLARLKCADGSTPDAERVGSFGSGPYGTIIDGYSLTCAGVTRDDLVYMDMYHPGHVEAEAVAGFTID